MGMIKQYTVTKGRIAVESEVKYMQMHVSWVVCLPMLGVLVLLRGSVGTFFINTYRRANIVYYNDHRGCDKVNVSVFY